MLYRPGTDRFKPRFPVADGTPLYYNLHSKEARGRGGNPGEMNFVRRSLPRHRGGCVLSFTPLHVVSRTRRWATAGALAVVDLPGAVGSFAGIQQLVGVASLRDADGVPTEKTVLDFSFLSVDCDGDLAGFAESPGTSVAPKRMCSFTLDSPPAGAHIVVHLLPRSAACVAYHNLPPLLPATAALRDRRGQTRTGTVWPSGDGDLHEVRAWRTAVAMTVEAVVPIRGKTLVLAAVDAVTQDQSTDGTELLVASSFLAREELLVQAFRSRTLLLCDFSHEARLSLSWWYARKFGRNRAAGILLAGFLSYLRRHDAEGLYNATETQALLHLVSHAMFTTSGPITLQQFLTAQPHLGDPNVLEEYYTPDLLASRQSRIAFQPPNKRDFEGASYPTAVQQALDEDAPILVQEGQMGPDPGNASRRGSYEAMPFKATARLRPGQEDMYVDSRATPHTNIRHDWGPAPAFADDKQISEPWRQRHQKPSYGQQVRELEAQVGPGVN
ncbi:hypothetical protein DIPPA_07025 [Diplonema papillatum]|nr:hypothetical protein DIPPA_07025 [Diplonema papillatum]